MYSGFPTLPVSRLPNYTLDQATTVECAEWTIVPQARHIRVRFPALCHLLHLSRTPSVRYGIFGRLYGIQVQNTVEVGNICMNLPRDRVAERETDEERRRRQEEEQERTRSAFEQYESVMSSELLDAYHVGLFVICSSTFNPFAHYLLNQMNDLLTSAQPGVLLIYDPFRTALLGKPYLKAYTLTDEYVAYALKKSEKQKKTTQLKAESKLLKEFGVTRSGVFREIPVELDVDAFQQLGLESVETTPTTDSFTAIHREAVSTYIEALLSAIQENTNRLTKSLDLESKALEKDHSMSSATQPLGQSIDTQLTMFVLKEQTQHLEALCDSILLNCTIVRDLQSATPPCA